MDLLDIVIFSLIGTVGIGFFVFLIILGIRSDKQDKTYDEDKEREAEERLEQEPEYTKTRATLLSMKCGVDVRGTKQVSTKEKYFITFELENGEKAEFEVENEIYLLLEEGMTGTLVTTEAGFYGFESDN